MKRIVLWLLGTVSAVALLLGYHTSTAGPSGASTTAAPLSGAAGGGGSSGGTGGSSNGSSAGSGSGSGAGGGSRVVTGDVADTRWGPVQVQLALTGGDITKVTVLQYPNDTQRDADINSYALPILIKETMSAHNANIDMVSGATVTSDGYVQSLQSALDKAGL